MLDELKTSHENLRNKLHRLREELAETRRLLIEQDKGEKEQNICANPFEETTKAIIAVHTSKQNLSLHSFYSEHPVSSAVHPAE